jgi:outer membrane lipoprotein SlyB
VLFDGSGISGVRIGGLPGNPATTGNGQYVAPVPPGWNGTVTPALTGYAFNPPTKTYQNVGSVIIGEDYAAYRSGSLQISTGTIPAGRRNAS